jgi:hypothetical protein
LQRSCLPFEPTTTTTTNSNNNNTTAAAVAPAPVLPLSRQGPPRANSLRALLAATAAQDRKDALMDVFGLPAPPQPLRTATPNTATPSPSAAAPDGSAPVQPIVDRLRHHPDLVAALGLRIATPVGPASLAGDRGEAKHAASVKRSSEQATRPPSPRGTRRAMGQAGAATVTPRP